MVSPGLERASAREAADKGLFHGGVRNVLILQAVALAILALALAIALGDEPGVGESSDQSIPAPQIPPA